MWPPTLYCRSAILGLIQLFAAHSIEPSAFAASVQAQPNPTLIMEVSLRHPASDKYLLHVKIINRQKVSVSVLNGDLPWQTPNEFVLIPRGYRLDAEKSLMVRGGPFVDYMDIAHTLAPGQSLEGDITLHNMFRTLLSDVDKFGVIIEWSCRQSHSISSVLRGLEGHSRYLRAEALQKSAHAEQTSLVTWSNRKEARGI